MITFPLALLQYLINTSQLHLTGIQDVVSYSHVLQLQPRFDTSSNRCSFTLEKYTVYYSSNDHTTNYWTHPSDFSFVVISVKKSTIWCPLHDMTQPAGSDSSESRSTYKEQIRKTCGCIHIYASFEIPISKSWSCNRGFTAI